MCQSNHGEGEFVPDDRFYMRLHVRTRVNSPQNSCKLIFSARANSPEKNRSARANSVSNRAKFAQWNDSWNILESN